MKQIGLTQGKVAIVDDEDYPRISRHKWCALRAKGGLWYAVRSVTLSGHGDDRVRKHLLMHREILGVEDRLKVDHQNGDGLDNTRKNIRQATTVQNGQNRSIKPHTSRYKGVSWHKHSGRWRAAIVVAGRQVALGYFDDQTPAARAYDDAALRYFGEFARINAITA